MNGDQIHEQIQGHDEEKRLKIQIQLDFDELMQRRDTLPEIDSLCLLDRADRSSYLPNSCSRVSEEPRGQLVLFQEIVHFVQVYNLSEC